MTKTGKKRKKTTETFLISHEVSCNEFVSGEALLGLPFSIPSEHDAIQLGLASTLVNRRSMPSVIYMKQVSVRLSINWLTHSLFSAFHVEFAIVGIMNWERRNGLQLSLLFFQRLKKGFRTVQCIQQRKHKEEWFHPYSFVVQRIWGVRFLRVNAAIPISRSRVDLFDPRLHSLWRYRCFCFAFAFAFATETTSNCIRLADREWNDEIFFYSHASSRLWLWLHCGDHRNMLTPFNVIRKSVSKAQRINSMMELSSCYSVVRTASNVLPLLIYYVVWFN